MKTNHQPQATRLQNVKEIEAGAKTRMEKALTDLQHEMASHPHRPRLGEHLRLR